MTSIETTAATLTWSLTKDRSVLRTQSVTVAGRSGEFQIMKGHRGFTLHFVPTERAHTYDFKRIGGVFKTSAAARAAAVI